MGTVKHRSTLPITSNNGFSIVCITLLTLWLLPEKAKAQWHLEACGGSVYNMPLPLTIYQDGMPTLRLTAQFDSEPFTLPVYWDIRIGKVIGKRTIEAELIHHKLYLRNTNAEVQKFNVSHGFNMVIFNFGILRGNYHYRIGFGLVIAHPESKIRGLELGNSTDDWDMGYYLTGPTFSAGAERQITLSKVIYFAIGAKTTISLANIPIYNGHARFVNIAAHLNFGLGFKI